MHPLTVPPSLGSLESIRRYVALAADEARLDEKTAYRLRLAVDELVTNIVTHGYVGSTAAGEHIQVQAEAADGSVRVLLEDSGRAYDPRQAAAPRDLQSPLERRVPGGLGVFLAIRSTDGYEYERIGDRNRSTLVVKRIDGVRAGPRPDERELRIEHERQVGRGIQAGFLPATLPQPDGWQIAAHLEPALDVAGDFYDAFPLSNNRRIGLVIADVCGKGVPAALFMALVRSLTRAFARQHYSLDLLDALTGDVAPVAAGAQGGRRGRFDTPAAGSLALKKAVTLTSEYIIDNHGEQDMFATIFFGALDPRTGSLMYVNAGHNPPYVLGPRGIRAQLDPTGPALGIVPGAEYTIGQIRLEPGETLFAYTDGVTDARDGAGEFFGEDRLIRTIGQGAATAQELLHRVEESVHEHLGNAALYDDLTMLAVRRT